MYKFQENFATNYSLCTQIFNCVMLVYFLSVSSDHPVVARATGHKVSQFPAENDLGGAQASGRVRSVAVG